MIQSMRYDDTEYGIKVLSFSSLVLFTLFTVIETSCEAEGDERAESEKEINSFALATATSRTAVSLPPEEVVGRGGGIEH